MSIFQNAPEPKTALGRPRLLSPRCGLRVSPISLGAMSIGENWSSFLGSMTKENSFKLLDAFADAGGNWIDTANNYQGEESEEWLGEWMKSRKCRDEMVISTKFTTFYPTKEGRTQFNKANYVGNHRKSMMLSLEASLRKLQTSYVDILYLHWWDWTTGIEELMQGLNDLVRAGKVLYLGISDSPAWIVSKANQYARDHGMAQFVVYQGRWNVMLRDFERDILPMARDEGMALHPWDVVGGGKFQTKAQIEERKKQNESMRSMMGSGEQSEEEVKVSAALEEVAKETGSDSIQAVAIAYVMAKYEYCHPMVGGRKVEHLMSNIKALELQLTPEHIRKLEEATSFDIGFPMNFVGVPGTDSYPNFLTKSAIHLDVVPFPSTIQPPSSK